MTECEMYKHNVPSLVVEKHHVVPLSWWEAAGVLVDTPFAMLCPTCHMNTHWWMDRIISGKTPFPKLAPMRSFNLALKGINMGKVAGLTPRRTL